MGLIKVNGKKPFLASLGFTTYVSRQPDVSIVTPDLCWFRKRESVVIGPDEKRGELGPPDTKLSIHVEKPSPSFIPQASETASCCIIAFSLFLLNKSVLSTLYA